MQSYTTWACVLAELGTLNTILHFLIAAIKVMHLFDEQLITYVQFA